MVDKAAQLITKLDLVRVGLLEEKKVPDFCSLERNIPAVYTVCVYLPLGMELLDGEPLQRSERPLHEEPGRTTSVALCAPDLLSHCLAYTPLPRQIILLLGLTGNEDHE